MFQKIAFLLSLMVTIEADNHLLSNNLVNYEPPNPRLSFFGHNNSDDDKPLDYVALAELLSKRFNDTLKLQLNNTTQEPPLNNTTQEHPLNDTTQKPPLNDTTQEPPSNNKTIINARSIDETQKPAVITETLGSTNLVSDVKMAGELAVGLAVKGAQKVTDGAKLVKGLLLKPVFFGVGSQMKIIGSGLKMLGDGTKLVGTAVEDAGKTLKTELQSIGFDATKTRVLTKLVSGVKTAGKLAVGLAVMGAKKVTIGAKLVKGLLLKPVFFVVGSQMKILGSGLKVLGDGTKLVGTAVKDVGKTLKTGELGSIGFGATAIGSDTDAFQEIPFEEIPFEPPAEHRSLDDPLPSINNPQ